MENVGKDIKQFKHSNVAGEGENQYNHFGKTLLNLMTQQFQSQEFTQDKCNHMFTKNNCTRIVKAALFITAH